MPVRRIPPSHRSLTGRVAGAKCVGEAAFESTLERDLLLVLEFAPVAAVYEVQPVRIPYVDERGRARTYTPDVLIHRQHPDGSSLAPLLCEVKYRTDVKRYSAVERRVVVAKFRAARRYARERGWCFRLLTERHIRSPYLQNARFLLPFRTHPARTERLARIVRRVEERGSEPADQLLAAVAEGPGRGAHSDYSWCIPGLWHLLATGQLVADYTVPLTMQTAIYHRGYEAGPSLQGDPIWLHSYRTGADARE